MKNIVLISTFNGQKYVEKQIDSIFSCLSKFPVVIYWYDDGSTDGTVDLLTSYNDSRIIRITKNGKCSVAKNFLHLLKIAVDREGHENIFYFADQDDIWSSEKIVNTEKYLENKCGLLLSSTITFGGVGEKIVPNINRPFFLDITFNISPGMSYAFRATSVNKLLDFSNNFEWHDHSVFIFFKYIEKQIHIDKSVNQFYRRHMEALTLDYKRGLFSRMIYALNNLKSFLLWKINYRLNLNDVQNKYC